MSEIDVYGELAELDCGYDPDYCGDCGHFHSCGSDCLDPQLPCDDYRCCVN
jgi:hypothetical protein